MSYQAMAWATSIKLPITEKMVLLMLANRASHDDGSCYPSLNRVADECGVDRRTVIRAIKRLEEKYLLKVVRTVKNNGENNSNKYFLNIGGGSVTESLGSVTESLGSVTESLGGSVTESPKSITSLTNQLTSQIIRTKSYDELTDEQLNNLTELELLSAFGVTGQIANDFLKVRKAKTKVPLTVTAMRGNMAEAKKAGLTIIEAITIAAQNSWQAFNSRYIQNDKKQQGRYRLSTADIYADF